LPQDFGFYPKKTAFEPAGAQMSDHTETTNEPGQGSWRVDFTLKNVGDGTMPLTVAASRGERFAEDPKKARLFREKRVSLVLGPGESQELSMVCDFDPQRLEVDPDVSVLQLQREAAIHRF
jgi:hypothetical protein